MQLMPPSRTDDGPVTRRNSARGSNSSTTATAAAVSATAHLRSPVPSTTTTNNRLYRAPQAAVRNINRRYSGNGSSGNTGGDRVGDALFGNLRAQPQPQQPPSSSSQQQQQRPNSHHHVGPLSPRNNINNSSKGCPASVGATAGTRRRRRGEVKGQQSQQSQSQQQQRGPSYLMEKQSSEASLGCISLTNNSNSKEKGGEFSNSYSKFCLSPHNGMPAPPLWTDDVVLHLSPPPLFSSLSPNNNNNSSINNSINNKQSCLSSITPPSTRRLSTTPCSYHGAGTGGADSSHHNNNNTHAYMYNNDHSEGHYLLDEDSFGNASNTHHSHSHSCSNHHIICYSGSNDAHHNTTSRNSSSLRVKQQQRHPQNHRFCVQRVIRNSCWYAAAAVQPASHGNSNSSSKRATTKKTWHLFYAAFKVLVVAACAGFVYDSHHRVRTHKQQMQEYESERAHILEQMIWIDKAAKKVHKKYSTAAAAAASLTMTTTTSSLQHNDLAGKITMSSTATANDSLQQMKQLQTLQSSLDKLQVRIQLNARDLLAQKFGDRPAQVSLQIKKRLSSSTSTTSDATTSDNQHLVVALSDDTPHATATFVQQIDGHYWDDLEFETITTTTTTSGSGSSSSDASMIQAIQILSKNRTSASPLLEFVEPSRKCHSVGSVALRQVPQGPLKYVLVLRIYLTEQQPAAPAGPAAAHQQYGNDFDDDDEEEEQEVCIGKVLHGLDHVLLPELLIQQERQQELEQKPLLAEAQRKEPRLQQRQVMHDRQEEEQEQQQPPEQQQEQEQPELDEEYHGGPPEEDIPMDLLMRREPQAVTTTIQHYGNERHDMNGRNDNSMDHKNGNMVHNDYPATNSNTRNQQQLQRLRGPSLLAKMKAGVAAGTARDMMREKEDETPSFVPLNDVAEGAEDAQDWLQELLLPLDETTIDKTGGSRLY